MTRGSSPQTSLTPIHENIREIKIDMMVKTRRRDGDALALVPEKSAEFIVAPCVLAMDVVISAVLVTLVSFFRHRISGTKFNTDIHHFMPIRLSGTTFGVVDPGNRYIGKRKAECKYIIK
jgi:hypothetical protein